jgi:catechol 2,3-dioxygenase-like lactoylglutathione lyase family enzyme
MQVSGVDHVNILTDDLDGTATFYQDLLGLRRGENAGAAMGFKGAWMHDAQGNAIVHISWNDPSRDFGADHVLGGTTGSVHHVAFRCQGFDAMRQHLEGLGIEHNVMERPGFSFRQITLRDPNNINLELNFAGD